MRFTRNVSRAILLACVVVGIAASGVRALPPDPNNAALLYYQAFLLMPQNQEQMRALIQDLPYGVEPNEQIREYLKQCQPAIDLAVAASRIPACDWGLQYSQGSQMRMAHLGEVRRLAGMLRDDSKVLVADGQYRQALDRCLVLRRLAVQVGDETLISYLVSISINAFSESTIAKTLSAMPLDAEVLASLQGELNVTSRSDSAIQSTLRTEEECLLASLSLGNDRLIGGLKTTDTEVPPGLIERLKSGDKAFLEGSRKYLQSHFSAMRAILDSPAPYAQKFSRLEALDKRPGTDAKEDPHALLTAAFIPSIARVLTLDTRAKSNDNRLTAAVEIYLVKARIGSLPGQLPAGALKDPFTGQDFKYEKTKDGFRLSRWTDDPKADKTWQFEFKVK